MKAPAHAHSHICKHNVIKWPPACPENGDDVARCIHFPQKHNIPSLRGRLSILCGSIQLSIYFQNFRDEATKTRRTDWCHIIAVSQFRGCILRRTWLLWSLKASPLERPSKAFEAFPGCVTRCFTLTSRFLPPSDDLHHTILPFSVAKNLGIIHTDFFAITYDPVSKKL